MTRYTSEHGWPVQEPGDTDYENTFDQLVNQLDIDVVLRDTYANRPTAGTADRIFVATDTHTIYYDDGTNWNAIGGFDMDGTNLTDGNTVIWDATNAYVPTSSLQTISLGVDTDTDFAGSAITGVHGSISFSSSNGNGLDFRGGDGSHYLWYHDDGTSTPTEWRAQLSSGSGYVWQIQNVSNGNYFVQLNTNGNLEIPQGDVYQGGFRSLTTADEGSGGGINADQVDGKHELDLRQESPNAHLPMTELADTDYASIPVHIPANQTLYVWVWGARTDAQGTPTGLTVELYDETGGASVLSQNTAHNTSNPITSLSAGSTASDATLRLNNGTGGTVNAGAKFGYTVE